MLPLSELLAGTTILRTGGDQEILSLRVEPRQVAEGNVFFKLHSWQFRTSAAEAIRRGARYVVLEAGDEEEATLLPSVSYAIVDNVNRAFARACSRMFGDAHQQLTLIGVTGAKGKTTVCHLIEGALRASSVRAGLISSLVLRLPESEHPANSSTPDALSMHSFLAALRAQGGTHAVLEITSFGIAEERLFGLRFDALAFTNLGTGGGDGQQLANLRLFTDPAFHKSPRTLCAFNSDDPAGRELASSSLGRVVTFGFGAADVTPELYSSDSAGIALRLNGHDLRSPLIGRHNAMNVLAAAAIVGGVTQSEEAVLRIQSVGSLPGRMERLPTPIGVDVYLDQPYAPWSVEVSLASVREFAGSRRVVCVIGCASGSDKGKRPLIAMAAMKGSDVCILTSYDPGDEHPASIVMDMLKGVRHVAPGRLKTIIDRPTAIAYAIREALPDGIVVLMGKRMMGGELRNGDRQVAIDVLHEVRSQSTAEPLPRPDLQCN
jgi:UDP-N-acetylmuramoyl-L-alanyl-D-glutamate--2,6-diaminopimelate ligase